MNGHRNHSWVVIILLVLCGAGGFFFFRQSPRVDGVAPLVASASPEEQQPTATSDIPVTPPQPEVTHIQTPTPVRGAYFTAWTTGTPRMLDRVSTLADTDTINAVVIDIKDATGRISYHPSDPALQVVGSGTNRIRDLAGTVRALHDKGIYVIGRVQVFQDSYFAAAYPEEAFHMVGSDELWRDRKGLAWLRPSSEKVWEYVSAIAHDAYAQGVDEINIDYVRFPSDGDLKALDLSKFDKSRVDTLTDFFTYMDTHVRGDGIPLSADIFGLTLSAVDDMGIGQMLTMIAPHVDYVCPMIYPSHFARGSYGYTDPASHPYEIIKKSLSDGITKLNAATIPKEKLRPWLQVFDLGAVYTRALVDDQTRATEELGLDSWLFWDPKNIYAPLLVSQPSATDDVIH